jgi:dihydrofolate reductase
VIVATSLDAALQASNAPNVDTTFVIGGAEILREALAHRELRWVYLTRVEGHFQCEVQIPNLDVLGFTPAEWEGACEGEDSGIRYRIERLAPPKRS